MPHFLELGVFQHPICFLRLPFSFLGSPRCFCEAKGVCPSSCIGRARSQPLPTSSCCCLALFLCLPFVLDSQLFDRPLCKRTECPDSTVNAELQTSPQMSVSAPSLALASATTCCERKPLDIIFYIANCVTVFACEILVLCPVLRCKSSTISKNDRSKKSPTLDE